MILNHYPPVIKQIKDIQQIAKAEDIEFTKLNTSITEVIRNMFVFTADETGVKRFEKLLGITPKAAQSLDDRKIYIISMMNRRKMSLEELTAMLSNYSEGIRLINDMSNFEMIVEINTDAGSLETINSIIDEILPLNSSYEVSNYSLLAHSVGNYLSTPVLYLVSNVGKSSFRNLHENISISRIILRINNSFSANYPIIVTNADFEVDIASCDLCNIQLTLVDANMHEIHLLNPIYITIAVKIIKEEE